MTSPYFPHTAEDVRQMLEGCGMTRLEELFSEVPSQFLYDKPYDLPKAMSESQVRDFFANLCSQVAPLKIFAGQGAYDHYSPSTAQYLISRSEFLTAYTPYQAEISQGTLRYIFEFQSMICALTGMDVANASLYDGATACAEAMLMCMAATKKKTRFLLSTHLFGNIIKTVETYAHFHGVELSYFTTLDELKAELAAGDVAGALVPGINRFGVIENLAGYAEALHEAKALLSVYNDPSTLAVIKTPAEWGADIAVGDCQSLGIPISFGGPYLGYMATKMDYVRKMPGRIVGQTEDRDGKRCYCLTLQAREQHIRRDKATSNICSNQSLMALYVTIYLSLMGAEGLRKANAISSALAHRLYDGLLATGKFESPFDGQPFVKEFTLKAVDDKNYCSLLAEKGYLAALPTEEGYITFAVTEKRTAEEVDALIKTIAAL
ncbi:MAG: aminomethyl-transferring glycine dehydrogenase subunit GcvPA [Bacteroidales bacterium]|nr:aminomethyl-transferring glycine dehydrogenase subunit GcvPA [Bacteroidales bacterium]